MIVRKYEMVLTSKVRRMSDSVVERMVDQVAMPALLMRIVGEPWLVRMRAAVVEREVEEVRSVR